MSFVCTGQPNASPSPSPRREESTDARRTVGRLGEELAAEHLTRLGFTTLARNVRTRYGEIDLIVFDGRVIAFVEVKTQKQRVRRTADPRRAGAAAMARARASAHACGASRARG